MSTLLAVLPCLVAFQIADGGDEATRAPAPEGGTGRVLAVANGLVLIQGGSNVGFEQGQTVAIYSATRPGDTDAIARASGMPTRGLLTAVLTLDRVEASRSTAIAGRGDGPEPGDLVVITVEETTASLIAPHWVPFNWRIGFSAQLFVAVGGDQHPLGMLGVVYVDYYFSAIPLRFEVGVQPFGFVANSATQHNPAILDATVAFYLPYLELGFGGGVSILAQPCLPLEPCGNSTVSTFDQSVRLGALDGLSLTWHSSIGVQSHNFVVAAGRGALNFPLATRLTLYFDGGASSGFRLFDVGLRGYLGGVGGPGTFILSGGLGYAAIIDNLDDNLEGPAISLGCEVRL